MHGVLGFYVLIIISAVTDMVYGLLAGARAFFGDYCVCVLLLIRGEMRDDDTAEYFITLHYRTLYHLSLSTLKL